MNSESCVINSKIGPLRVVVEWPGVLKRIDFLPEETDEPFAEGDGIPELCRPTVAQLNDYFEGKRTSFDLELDPEGTEFQRTVWAELERIPHGEVISYGEQAKRMKRAASSSRAVGHANGSNPIPIVIPCHRVVAADGKLTGFAGGLWRKVILLEHEGHEVVKERLVRPTWETQGALSLGEE
ncbi:methylated-DNA--[protein]-cysteine S-methyltransferase [bacterium]|nr:methylated-DNA--[protein]-cysteine S-methyltransferase [bacterium]